MKFDNKAKQAIKFLVGFIVLTAVFYGIVAITRDNIFMGYVNATAYIASMFLKIFGVHSNSGNGIITDGSFALYLAFGCEGSEPIMIFAAATLAFPAKWKDKLTGLVAGVLILYVLNLVRILALFFIGKHFPDSFRSFHGEIFPVIFIFLAIIVWFLWINRLPKIKKPAA